MPLQIGDRAPEVTLTSDEIRKVELGRLYGEKPLVVLFFPLAFTSTCTEELCTMADDLGSYAALDAQVVAVSVDSPFVLQRFRQECRATFPFLSDFHRDAARAFGVLREGPLGPGLEGVSDRAAFVVGRDRRIAWVWHSTNPSLLPPFDEIKEVLGSGF
jgi:glutaredoxin-dependent peroxiredoxin